MEAHILGDFRKIPLPDNSVDLIIFDPPFTEVKNSLEGHKGIKSMGGKTFRYGRREFYFRGLKGKWIPPEAYFFQTWREFNRVSRNGLMIKISERFKDLEEVPVLTYADLAYNKRFNKKSVPVPLTTCSGSPDRLPGTPSSTQLLKTRKWEFIRSSVLLKHCLHLDMATKVWTGL